MRGAHRAWPAREALKAVTAVGGGRRATCAGARAVRLRRPVGDRACMSEAGDAAGHAPRLREAARQLMLDVMRASSKVSPRGCAGCHCRLRRWVRATLVYAHAVRVARSLVDGASMRDKEDAAGQAPRRGEAVRQLRLDARRASSGIGGAALSVAASSWCAQNARILTRYVWGVLWTTAHVGTRPGILLGTHPGRDMQQGG